MNRKSFIKSLIGASAFLGSSFTSYSNNIDSIIRAIEDASVLTHGNLFGFRDAPIPKVNIGIIGLGNRGNILLEMLERLHQDNYCEIVALSDIEENKITTSIDKLHKWQKSKPHTYYGSKNAWKDLANQDNIDLIIIATPWETHTPMCIYSMKQGKHVASEIPIAYSLTDCWSLIKTAEKTQRHCIMLENCCYNEEELFILNMVENGVFGDITHTEGAYLHDLRAHLLSSDYYQNQWRIKHHVERNGNLYTTHGLGPISFYMKIARGDTYSHLTSMSSRELNLSETAKKTNSSFLKFKCGDINTTLIKTKLGKTILLQYDVHTGRPYSRINKVVGTKAVHDGYPSRLYIDSNKPKFKGHKWLDNTTYNKYKTDFEHPIIKKLKVLSSNFSQGHGGMDFVMMYRLIRCLNLGLPLDINVYDSVMWSAISPLSELSAMHNSTSIPIPDFTSGHWKKNNKLEIMRDI